MAAPIASENKLDKVQSISTKLTQFSTFSISVTLTSKQFRVVDLPQKSFVVLLEFQNETFQDITCL